MPCWEGWQRCVPSRSWQASACSDCAVQLRGGITQGRLMSLAMLRTRASLGLEAPEVQVEVHLSNGLPGLSIVGLPEAAVKESRERVRSALLNAGFEFPARRITLNLAPADLPKEGGRFDLPIALGILVASGQIPEEAVAAMECLGELALDGSIRAVTGVLPAALCCRKAGRTLVVPRGNADEAALAEELEVLAVGHLLELVAHLLGRERLTPHVCSIIPQARLPEPDLSEVRGQHQARRALEIAAAGGHNLLALCVWRPIVCAESQNRV